MKLSRDFKEFVECLNVSDVRYLVIGGYAVAYHGRPRYTKDLDIWLEASHDNGLKVVQALERFGFADLGLTAADFEIPDNVIQLGYEPQRIDLLTSAQGVDFQEAWTQQCSASVQGMMVRVVGLEQLKANKRSVARPQDLADVDALSP